MIQPMYLTTQTPTEKPNIFYYAKIDPCIKYERFNRHYLPDKPCFINSDKELEHMTDLEKSQASLLYIIACTIFMIFIFIYRFGTVIYRYLTCGLKKDSPIHKESLPDSPNTSNFLRNNWVFRKINGRHRNRHSSDAQSSHEEILLGNLSSGSDPKNSKIPIIIRPQHG